MIDVRRAADRYEGGDPAAGITTRHAFSFGSFYDPDNIRFGPVLACNEETLRPGSGFEEHAHSHTEIVTWVVEGELTHKDSAGGHSGQVRPGDVQHFGTGSGARHVERNDGPERLRFVQTWLAPLVAGGEPSYTLVRDLADGAAYEIPRPVPYCACGGPARASGSPCRSPSGSTCTSSGGTCGSTGRNWAPATRRGSPARAGWRSPRAPRGNC